MNTGSRLILLAARSDDSPPRTSPPNAPPGPADVHAGILAMEPLGEAVLMVQVVQNCDISAIRESLATHPITREYLFHVLVWPDVPLDDSRLMLWGWFTRFDPIADLHPLRREQVGNQLVMHSPIAIDATWKEGYRLPVAFDPDRAQYVEENWQRYGIELPGDG